MSNGNNGNPWGYTPLTDTEAAQGSKTDPALQAADTLLDQQEAAVHAAQKADLQAAIQLEQERRATMQWIQAQQQQKTQQEFQMQQRIAESDAINSGAWRDWFSSLVPYALGGLALAFAVHFLGKKGREKCSNKSQIQF